MRHGICVKMASNYPPRPPMPASHRPAQVLHIPADYQSPEHSGTVGNLEWPYPGFCLITINAEDVAVIVVNIDAVVHRVIFCEYQFHCYQSFQLKWR